MTAVHLIRHAKAKNRQTWSEPDHLRPLTKRGRREADAIAARLGEEPLTRLVSSPFVRCVQTLEPLAAALDVPIETTALLAEGADGERAVELLLSLAGSGGPIACCTHGDVLFDVVDLVAGSGIALDGPRMAPVASTWVLGADAGRFVEARFVDQPAR
jgi:8-oxo-dGTP diphosphatase